MFPTTTAHDSTSVLTGHRPADVCTCAGCNLLSLFRAITSQEIHQPRWCSLTVTVLTCSQLGVFPSVFKSNTGVRSVGF